jgi:hypothetical protein
VITRSCIAAIRSTASGLSCRSYHARSLSVALTNKVAAISAGRKLSGLESAADSARILRVEEAGLMHFVN